MILFFKFVILGIAHNCGKLNCPHLDVRRLSLMTISLFLFWWFGKLAVFFLKVARGGGNVMWRHREIVMAFQPFTWCCGPLLTPSYLQGHFCPPPIKMCPRMLLENKADYRKRSLQKLDHELAHATCTIVFYISWSAHISRGILIGWWLQDHVMVATFHQSMVPLISTNPIDKCVLWRKNKPWFRYLL